MIKKIFIILFAITLILSFNTLGFENDGANFIAKPELDALQANFDSTLNEYMQKIDNMITKGIEDYLRGVGVKYEMLYIFPFAGEKVAVFDSSKVQKLKMGKAGINWMLDCTIYSYRNDKADSFFHVNMNRDATKEYEFYKLDETGDNFEWYTNEGILNTKVGYTFQQTAGMAYFNPSDTLNIRWHASPWYASILDRSKSSTGIHDYQRYYDDRVSKAQFYQIYASGLNTGTTHEFEKAEGARINTFSVVIEVDASDKIKYVMDGNESNTKSKIWIYDPKYGANKDYVSGAPTSALYDTTRNEFPTPSDAGINTTGYGIGIGRRNTTTSDKYWSDLGWTRYGDYQTTATSGTITAGPWYELHIEPQEKNQSIMKNINILRNIIDEYSPYGFNGYIIEGLPIGIFERKGKGGIIEFELDTTPLTVNSRIGISSKPFNNTTNKLSSLTTDENFNLYVDDIKQTNNLVNLTAAKHKIKIELKEGKYALLPLFYKMSLNSTEENNKKCFVFNIPNEYKYIMYE